MMETFREWLEEFNGLLTTLGLVFVAILTAFKKTREAIMAPIRRRKLEREDEREFRNHIREDVKEAKRDRLVLLSEVEKVKAMSEKSQKALFNGGKGGLVRQVAVLSAQFRADFEELPYPAFQCNEHGKNFEINAAYRQLVGVTRLDDLSGTQWQQVICGKKREEYIQGFCHSAVAKEPFWGECDFQNPETTEHRGDWRIHGDVVDTGDGLVYVGRFKAALDERAKEIAEEYQWQVRLA